MAFSARRLAGDKAHNRDKWEPAERSPRERSCQLKSRRPHPPSRALLLGNECLVSDDGPDTLQNPIDDLLLLEELVGELKHLNPLLKVNTFNSTMHMR